MHAWKHANGRTQGVAVGASVTAKQFEAFRRSILIQGAAVTVPVGAAIAVYYAIWEPVGRLSRLSAAAANLVSFVIFLAVIVAASNLVLKHWLAPHLPWAVEGAAPGEEDRSRLIYLPVRAAIWILVVTWVVTVVVTATNLAVGHQPVAAAGTGIGLFLAGFTFAAIVYLQTERALRRLFALALTNTSIPRRRSVGVRPRLVLAWTLGSALPLLFIVAIPLRASSGDRLPIIVPMLYMAIGGLVLGGITTLLAARSVAEPIESVREGLERVRDGNLDTELEVTNPGDLGLLQAGFNEMVTGLRHRRTLEDLFGRHVGKDVAQQALGAGIELGGEARNVTALFVDIIGSTAFAESKPPRVVVNQINELFQVVFDEVSAGGGWINKFEGDGCLCVFGAPSPLMDHPAHGLATARNLAVRLSSVGLEVGIGVSSGEVVAGNVGSVERFEYTVIGRPINEAARLTDASKSSLGRVLASRRTVDASGLESSHWEQCGDLELRGLRQALPVSRPRESP